MPMKNEIILLVDRKLDIKDIEQDLAEQLEELEKKYQDKLSQLNAEEKEYIQRCYERIERHQKEMEEREKWVAEVLNDDEYDEIYKNVVLEHSKQYKQESEEYLAKIYDDIQNGYTEYKEYELQWLNEKKNNVALVFDMSKLGFSDDAFAYISNIVYCKSLKLYFFRLQYLFFTQDVL